MFRYCGILSNRIAVDRLKLYYSILWDIAFRLRAFFAGFDLKVNRSNDRGCLVCNVPAINTERRHTAEDKLLRYCRIC